MTDDLKWADTPAGVFNSFFGARPDGDRSPEESRRGAALAVQELEAERAVAAHAVSTSADPEVAAHWAAWADKLSEPGRLARRAASYREPTPLGSEPTVTVGELVDRLGYGIRPAVSGCGQRHSYSRQGAGGVWVYPCGCLDANGTAAWRAREQRAELEAGRRHAVAPPTGDEW